jgi:hypothetical protein
MTSSPIEASTDDPLLEFVSITVFETGGVTVTADEVDAPAFPAASTGAATAEIARPMPKATVDLRMIRIIILIAPPHRRPALWSDRAGADGISSNG